MESDCLSIDDFSSTCSRQLGFVDAHKNLHVVASTSSKWCKHDSSRSRARERQSKWKTVKTAIEPIRRPYTFQDGRQFSQALFTKVEDSDRSDEGLGSRLGMCRGTPGRRGSAPGSARLKRPPFCQVAGSKYVQDSRVCQHQWCDYQKHDCRQSVSLTSHLCSSCNLGRLGTRINALPE